MCGRYTLIVTLAWILTRFHAESHIQDTDYTPNYNIAPGQNVLAIINDGTHNRLGYLRWGLIPPWAKDEKIGYRLINARAETIAEKPSFRNAFERKRCLIVADSFYEWKHDPDHQKMKIPLRFRIKSDDLFAMAGLWETWTSPEGQKIHSCAIVTTEANELMAPVHNRMPVILRKEDEQRWIDPANHDLSALKNLLKPYMSGRMEAYEVSPAVNSVKNNGPGLIRRVPGGSKNEGSREGNNI